MFLKIVVDQYLFTINLLSQRHEITRLTSQIDILITDGLKVGSKN